MISNGLGEVFASLTCYQTGTGLSYTYSYMDTSFISTTAACMSPLEVICVEDPQRPIRIDVNEQNELILDKMAAQVEVYGLCCPIRTLAKRT